MLLTNNNEILSPKDERDYSLSAYLGEAQDEIPADFEVWKPPTIEDQKAKNCVAQVFALITECRHYQLYAAHKEYSVGYIFGTNLNQVNNGMYGRTGALSAVKEGDVLREVWECDDENPMCRAKRNALPADVHAQANKFFEAAVRLTTKEELQRYILHYKLPALIIAPMSAYWYGDGLHATACYGWLSRETYDKEYGYREYKDLRYVNSWGEFLANGIINSEKVVEMWGLIPKKTEDKEEENMRGTHLLHPELQKICDTFVKCCNFNGLNVKITDTLRTKEEQQELYAQGRTKAGEIVTNVQYPNSMHCWGVAFDICRNEKGREYDNSDGFFDKCGTIGEALGLTWGGSWKTFKDLPHFELPEYSIEKLKLLYKSPDNFIASFEDLFNFDANKVANAIPQAFNKLALKPASDWALEALSWAQRKGIMRGDGLGNLMPKKPLTREEAAQIFYNIYGSEV